MIPNGSQPETNAAGIERLNAMIEITESVIEQLGDSRPEVAAAKMLQAWAKHGEAAVAMLAFVDKQQAENGATAPPIAPSYENN